MHQAMKTKRNIKATYIQITSPLLGGACSFYCDGGGGGGDGTGDSGWHISCHTVRLFSLALSCRCFVLLLPLTHPVGFGRIYSTCGPVVSFDRSLLANLLFAIVPRVLGKDRLISHVVDKSTPRKSLLGGDGVSSRLREVFLLNRPPRSYFPPKKTRDRLLTGV